VQEILVWLNVRGPRLESFRRSANGDLSRPGDRGRQDPAEGRLRFEDRPEGCSAFLWKHLTGYGAPSRPGAHILRLTGRKGRFTGQYANVIRFDVLQWFGLRLADGTANWGVG
jgi:hypothetical protein